MRSETATISGGSSAPAPVRARLSALGGLLGFPVAVSDDAEWSVEPSGLLRVGLGYFAERGFAPDEAEALALLEMWATARPTRTAPERLRRARALAGSRPELRPLLATIDRLQAAGELLATFPALRGALAMATARTLPELGGVVELRSDPRHLQFLAGLLRLVLAPGPALAVDVEVQRALDACTCFEGEDALRRIVAPDAHGPIRRLERALALLLPPYERLLALDAEERGWSDGSGDPDAPGRDADGEGEGLGAGGAGDGEDADRDAGTEPDSGAGSRADPADTDPRGGREGSDAGEPDPADLFAIEREDFLGTVLSTPIPADGTLVARMLQAAEEAARVSAGTGDPLGGTPASIVPGDATLASYRERLGRLGEPIGRVRGLWQRIISERVSPRSTASRRATPDGDALDLSSLPSAVAQLRAGAGRPAAFLHRETRPRRARRAGSTDYVFLVDRSGSMQGRLAEAAADAALVMLEALAGAQRDIEHAERAAGIPLDLGIRTALAVFDGSVHPVKPLSAGLDDAARRSLDREIRRPQGATNDAAALRFAAEQLGIARAAPGGTAASSGSSVADGSERLRIVILLSDGGSNDPFAAAGELRRLRAGGARVFGVGLGSEEVLRRYAPTSVRVDDPRELPAALEALVASAIPEGRLV